MNFKLRAKTRTQAGFSSGFIDDFARPLINRLPDGREQSADVVLHNMVDFWRSEAGLPK